MGERRNVFSPPCGFNLTHSAARTTHTHTHICARVYNTHTHTQKHTQSTHFHVVGAKLKKECVGGNIECVLVYSGSAPRRLEMTCRGCVRGRKGEEEEGEGGGGGRAQRTHTRLQMKSLDRKLRSHIDTAASPPSPPLRHSAAGLPTGNARAQPASAADRWIEPEAGTVEPVHPPVRTLSGKIVLSVDCFCEKLAKVNIGYIQTQIICARVNSNLMGYS